VGQLLASLQYLMCGLELHLRYRREESTSSISLTQKSSEALSLRSFRRHRKEFRSLRFFDGKCLFATGTRVRRRAVSDLKTRGEGGRCLGRAEVGCFETPPLLPRVSVRFESCTVGSRRMFVPYDPLAWEAVIAFVTVSK